MQITLVKHGVDHPPTHEDPGEFLWAGGYPDDELPGSIVTVLWPELDVGTWYSFDQFREKTQAVQDENTWTEVRVHGIHLHDHKATIQVKQDRAVRSIVEAVLELGAQLALSDIRRLWLRVE